MHAFDEVLEAHLIVALFVTMIVGAGGNAGNQPGVVITRALAKERDFIYFHLGAVMRIEAQVALVQGAIIGLVAFGRVLAEYPDETGSAFVIATTTGLMIFV